MQAAQAIGSIADRCGMPKGSWKLIAGRDVTVVGDANQIPSRAFICFVEGLQKADPPFRLGFIAEPPPAQRQ